MACANSWDWTAPTKVAEPAKGTSKIKITIEADDAEDLMHQLNTIIGTIDPPEPEDAEQECTDCIIARENRKATASAYTARATEAGSLTAGLWKAVALAIKGLDRSFGSLEGFEAVERIEQQIIQLKKER